MATTEKQPPDPTHETAKQPPDPTHELKDELSSLKKDLAELVETVTTMGKAQAESALHSAKEAVDHATEKVRMTAADARKQGAAAAEEIEVMVRKHPLTSMMMAVGLGYILGRTRH